ncbi:MAG: hypothetical protein P4L31_00815 [Candidatus Babeliales bacterium]|nr:hypothetical protein [Candidatus Babeliales bacterium]
MNKSLLCTIALIVAIALLSGSNKHIDNSYDENFIPYGIIAFDVCVYNTKTDKEYNVGSVATGYSNAQARLSDAQSMAYDFAESHNWKDWDYICYTVTNSSNCVTKVK